MKTIKFVFCTFLLVSGFSLGFTLVAGCVKEPKSEVDYGTEFRKSEIAQALKMAIGDNNPLEIKKNEFTQRDLTRVIRGRSIIDLVESVGLTVVKREESSRQLQLNLVEEKVSYDLTGGSNHKRIVREYLDCMNKVTLRAESCDPAIIDPNPIITETPSPTATPNPPGTAQSAYRKNYVLDSDSLSERVLSLFPQMAGDEDDETRVSYHQLKVSEKTMVPPQLVQDSPHCGGFTNCLINVMEVEFDQVNWQSFNKGEKIHIKVITSKEVPYLSRVLEKCQQGSVQIPQEGKPEKDWPRLLVTFCETVRNFEKGE